MKETITQSGFIQSFKDCGRDDNFSYDALASLYDYLIQYEEDCNTELELDPIGFCCEYAEYEDLNEFIAAYGDDYETIEDVERATTVIMVDDERFVIQQF